jgi:hypothetical protein
LQDIFQDFSLWLLKFLAVALGLLTLATLWTHRQRQKQQRKRIDADQKPLDLNPSAPASPKLAAGSNPI